MKLIIQIPCYNEADTLKIALDALPKEIPGIDKIEVLIINDGSKDNTVEVARDWGVDHIVSFTQNQGLAKGFMTGLETAISNGADIIVNTDADNQYNADDIEKLVQPIIAGEADFVIGARPIKNIEHFSGIKKRLQRLGSWVVRKASRTDIPDAPSGFRAISRDAALRLNVFNDYTYTLETIIQAGRKNMAIKSVPIRVNDDLRPSRLMKSVRSYIKISMFTIIRIFITYQPMKFFMTLGGISFFLGFAMGVRWIVLFFMGTDRSHVPSLIFTSILLTIGVLLYILGVVSDLISVNRKILEENQYRLRKLEQDNNNKKDKA